MKSIPWILFMFPLLISSFASAMNIEAPKTCKQCGMDRTAFAQSRMLVAYADGTTVGVCSLHCVALDLQQNRGKQVRSLMVADYSTKDLIDAKTATWVVGGKIKAVMSALAKWAFAKQEDARRFVEVNGGIIKSFDQTMTIASREVIDQSEDDKNTENELLRELK